MSVLVAESAVLGRNVLAQRALDHSERFLETTRVQHLQRPHAGGDHLRARIVYLSRRCGKLLDQLAGRPAADVFARPLSVERAQPSVRVLDLALDAQRLVKSFLGLGRRVAASGDQRLTEQQLQLQLPVPPGPAVPERPHQLDGRAKMPDGFLIR